MTKRIGHWSLVSRHAPPGAGRRAQKKTAAGGSPAAVGAGRWEVSAQLPDGVALAATLENVLLAFEPSVVMAAMHTTMMRASITAYSTAVGPSSFFTNSTNFRVIFRIFCS